MKNKLILTLLAGMVSSTAMVSTANAADDAAGSQQAYRAQDLKSFNGPENLFTGNVKVDMLFPENDVANYSAAYVTFEKGARTAWHMHPAGQHMIVTSGVALTGTRERKRERLVPTGY